MSADVQRFDWRMDWNLYQEFYGLPILSEVLFKNYSFLALLLLFYNFRVNLS